MPERTDAMADDRHDPRDTPDGAVPGGAVPGGESGTPPAGRDGEPDQTREFDPFADEDRPDEGGPDKGGPDDQKPDEPGPAADETARLPAADETAPMPLADGTGILPSAAQTTQLPATPGSWSGRAGVPPPEAATVRGATPPEWEPIDEGDGKRWWMPIVVGIIALLLAGGLIAGIWLIVRADDSDPAAPTPAPTTAAPTTAQPTSAAPTTSPPAPTTTAPVSVEVPPLVGLSEQAAAARLDARGLTYRLEFRPSSEPAGTVIETDPAAGATVPEGTQIVLVIAEAAPTSAPPTTAPGSTPTG